MMQTCHCRGATRTCPAASSLWLASTGLRSWCMVAQSSPATQSSLGSRWTLCPPFNHTVGPAHLCGPGYTHAGRMYQQGCHKARSCCHVPSSVGSPGPGAMLRLCCFLCRTVRSGTVHRGAAHGRADKRVPRRWCVRRHVHCEHNGVSY